MSSDVDVFPGNCVSVRDGVSMLGRGADLALRMLPETDSGHLNVDKAFRICQCIEHMR